MNEDSKHTATVQHMDKDFAVISLGDTGHLTVIPATAHLNEMFHFESEKLSVGRDLTVTITEPSSEHLGGRALVDFQLSSKKCNGSKAQDKGVEHKYKIGDFVTAKIKTVKPLCALVTLPDGVMGSVHVSQVHEPPRVGEFPTSSLKIGAEVNGRVIGTHKIHSHK